MNTEIRAMGICIRMMVADLLLAQEVQEKTVQEKTGVSSEDGNHSEICMVVSILHLHVA